MILCDIHIILLQYTTYLITFIICVILNSNYTGKSTEGNNPCYNFSLI